MDPVTIETTIAFLVERLSDADQAELERRLTEQSTGEPMQASTPGMDGARNARLFAQDGKGARFVTDMTRTFPNAYRLGR